VQRYRLLEPPGFSHGERFRYLNKLDAVKFYKNGKVDIWFKSAELAEEFTQKYLKWEGVAK
jgi:hypothetical protein